MGLRLIIEDDDGATTIVPLEDDAVTIGRQEGNTIQLTEKNVSRRHARLWQEEGSWQIEDLESYNGIKVNGVQIQQAVTLRDGDVVQIGDYHLALASETAVVAGLARDKAANVPEEPLLASSSAHLPALSGEEARALRAEAAGSGSRRLADDEDDEDDDRIGGAVPSGGGGKGALVAVALVVLVGGGALAWTLAGGSSSKGTAVARSKPAAAPAKPRAADAAPAPAEPAAEPAQAPAEPAAEPVQAPAEPQTAPAGDEGAGAPPPQPAADTPSPGAGVDDGQGSDAPGSRPRTKRKKRAAAPKAAPPPPPPQTDDPPPPPKDPAKLLQEARVAQIKGDAAKAYRLASEANAIKPSLAARKLMGAAACKMGDAGKAKKAYAKLSGGARDDMAKLCKSRGIDLP